MVEFPGGRSPAGRLHLETLKGINLQSSQDFVAMWFSEEMLKIYEIAISTGIANAGYMAHIVSQREHNDKIDDEIISQIRKSRFVLADFTGHRGWVYFEAGYAKGLGDMINTLSVTNSANSLTCGLDWNFFGLSQNKICPSTCVLPLPILQSI
jgi:hypothetical protein